MATEADEMILRRALTALERIEAKGCRYSRYESLQKRCIGDHQCESCIAHKALHP